MYQTLSSGSKLASYSKTSYSLPPKETSYSLPPEETGYSLPPEGASYSLPPEETDYSYLLRGLATPYLLRGLATPYVQRLGFDPDRHWFRLEGLGRRCRSDSIRSARPEGLFCVSTRGHKARSDGLGSLVGSLFGSSRIGLVHSVLSGGDWDRPELVWFIVSRPEVIGFVWGGIDLNSSGGV
ncbi:hypothetical protein Tco_1334425 [Tanacetum coccineum]